MPNPLDPVWEWYQLTLDCLRVTQRTARIGLDRAVTDKHATLFHRDRDARQQVIQDAKGALGRLAVVDLAAVFERTLRLHLTTALTGFMTGTHPVFGGALQRQVESAAEWWKFEELVDLYPTIDGGVRGQVKDVIKFRNWAAHGRHATAEPAPSNITPEEAYPRLTAFLTAAGIAT